VCDDLDLALTGIATGSLWVTRLRANLPTSALAADLLLEASASQSPVANVHDATRYTIPNYNPCPSASAGPSAGSCTCRTPRSPRAPSGPIALALAAVALVAAVARRRR
jgi:MYXO-CTERM domain-containing protein